MKHDRNVLITGASSGIGEALAKQYADLGFTVFACGRNEEKLSALAAYAANISPLVFDVTNEAETVTVLSKLPLLDIVILNAGDCGYIDNVMAFDGQLFARILQVNLVSMGYQLAQLLPKISVDGNLVFISSSVTKLALPKSQAYGASKAGLDYLANSLRLDLIPHGIKVCLVHPGFVETPLTAKNTFAMPMMISADHAATRIIKAVAKGKSYLAFPKRFTFLLTVMSFLPQRLLAKFLIGKTEK